MSTCSRCGISAWHPEARSCVLPACELRAAITLPPAAGPTTPGRPSVADAGSPRVGGGLVDQRAGDGEAERLGRGEQGGCIHDAEALAA